MHAIKSTALVLSALIGFVVWTAYHEGWMAPRISTSPLEPTGPNTEPPVAEYRDVHSGFAARPGVCSLLIAPAERPCRRSRLDPKAKPCARTCPVQNWLTFLKR